MPGAQITRTLLVVTLISLGVRLLVAGLLPIVTDEAYYLAWSHALDLGYFDHPPAVAWLGVGTLLFPSSAFAGRFLGVLVSTAVIPLCAGLYARAGVPAGPARLAALLLAGFNLTALSCGVLVLPDTLVLVAWCAALHEAAAALDGHPRRWLSAGLATGIGMYAKYTMVLIYPLLLLGILLSRPRLLRSAWPWAGLLLSLVTLIPNLAWNAEHGWIPVRFQMVHVLEGQSGRDLAFASDLPRPQAPGPAEIELGRRFGYEPQAPAAPKPTRSPSQRLGKLGGYLAGLPGLWGFLLIPVLLALVDRLRGRQPETAGVRAELRPLLLWSALIPAGLFAVISLLSKVEGNWPETYVFGAGAWFALWVARRPHGVLLGAALNLVGIVAAAGLVRWPLSASTGRLAKETCGYPELAQAIEGVRDPVFFERHQTGGKLRFYAPEVDSSAWPRLSRPSEFTRRASWNRWTAASLAQHGRFWLVSTNSKVPPTLPGFTAVAMQELRANPVPGGFEVSRWNFEPQPPADRGPALRRWSLIEYQPVGAMPSAPPPAGPSDPQLDDRPATNPPLGWRRGGGRAALEAGPRQTAARGHDRGCDRGPRGTTLHPGALLAFELRSPSTTPGLCPCLQSLS